MNKVNITFPQGASEDEKVRLHKEIEAWLIEVAGSAVTQRNNKSRRRKKWSIKSNSWDPSLGFLGISIFVRDPALMTLVTLRWT